MKIRRPLAQESLFTMPSFYPTEKDLEGEKRQEEEMNAIHARVASLEEKFSLFLTRPITPSLPPSPSPSVIQEKPDVSAFEIKFAEFLSPLKEVEDDDSLDSFESIESSPEPEINNPKPPQSQPFIQQIFHFFSPSQKNSDPKVDESQNQKTSSIEENSLIPIDDIEDNLNLSSPYANELRILADMGFIDADKNIMLLYRQGGKISEVISALLV